MAHCPVMAVSKQAELLSGDDGRGDFVVVNGRCQVRTEDGHRVVVIAGMTWAHYAVGDRMAEAHAMVGLVDQ